MQDMQATSALGIQAGPSQVDTNKNTFFARNALALQPELDRHFKDKRVLPHENSGSPMQNCLRALQEAASTLVKAAGSAEAGMAAAMRPLHASGTGEWGCPRRHH